MNAIIIPSQIKNIRYLKKLYLSEIELVAK